MIDYESIEPEAPEWAVEEMYYLKKERDELKAYSEWLENELLHYSKERCPNATIENIREVWQSKKEAGR